MAPALDVWGCVNILVAVIKQARADATAPKLCSPAERDRVQWEAQDFLADVVNPAKQECLLDVDIPHRRRGRGRRNRQKGN